MIPYTSKLTVMIVFGQKPNSDGSECVYNQSAWYTGTGMIMWVRGGGGNFRSE